MTPGETTANVSLEKVRADLQERARVPGLIVEGFRTPPRYLWTAATVAHVQAKQYPRARCLVPAFDGLARA
jgi:hypothetical protein